MFDSKKNLFIKATFIASRLKLYDVYEGWNFFQYSFGGCFFEAVPVILNLLGVMYSVGCLQDIKENYFRENVGYIWIFIEFS